MDIYELDSYRLSDAVKFHTELNPALWEQEKMRPEVRQALIKIAQDFKEFMGISDLAIEDVTVSGSNAAYSYTPHSDIDLHLIVDFNKLNPDEVYQELFNAKKYQYNDTHNIKIHGYDVELYVQDANKPVRSLGEYSIVNDDWIRVPVARKGNLDEKSTKSKYEKLQDLINLALESNDLAKVKNVTDTLKKYRQAGLDAKGEFGPENLAYKMLRTQGLIKQLFDHKAALEDQKLSLAERKKKKKKKTFKYGSFGGLWFPGYHAYGQSSEADAADGGDGGESVREDATVKVKAKEIPLDKVVRRFAHFAAKYLKLEKLPKIVLRGEEFGRQVHSFGHYVDDARKVEVETHGRHVMDVLRTLAHELVHYKQHERLGKDMPDTAGRTGSPYENEAHAKAGIIMRHFQNKYPEFFGAETVEEDVDESTVNEFAPSNDGDDGREDILFKFAKMWYSAPDVATQRRVEQALAKIGWEIGEIESEEGGAFVVQSGDVNGNTYIGWSEEDLAGLDEGIKNKLAAVAAAACIAGTPGCATTSTDALKNVQTVGRTAQSMKQMGRAGAEEELKGLVRDVLRKQRGVQEDASGYIPTKKQANDPRFKTALTVDIKPGQVGKEANKLGLKTNKQGQPNLLMKDLQNALREFKETGEYILESEQLDEVKMSPSALEAWANSPEAQGIRAGFEAEMIFRDTKREDDDEEQEPDYDYDERPDSIEHVVDFFSNDDYGYGLTRRGANDLRDSLYEEYDEWRNDKIAEDWDDDALNQVRDYMETNVWGDDEEREKRIQDKIDELFPDDDPEPILAAGEGAPRFTKSSDQQAYVNENELYAKYKEAYDAAYEDFEAEVESEYENQGNMYDDAREYYFEMKRDDDEYDESDFLRDQYGYMSDIESSHSLDWPYWTGGGSSGYGSRTWEEIADSLHDAVGMEVKVGSGYHSVSRKDNRWIIEPDGSLDPDDYEDAGLEIVSPPMPLPQALDKLKTVIEWGNNEANAYTNRSTGLHMGVSIPYKGGDVDYVKLVLFMGDEYILDKFGRASNTYADSAMKKLRQNVLGARNRGELKEADVKVKFNANTALELIKKNLIELAQRYIQNGVGTSKYTSAHIKDGYIEFRSPGGDYLSMESRGEYDDIKNTMLRFARAMYIAGRPDLERREYAKKLYKLIGTGSENNDALKLFSEYAAGTISQADLKKRWADAVLQKEIPSTGKTEYEIYDMANKNDPSGVIETFYASDYDGAHDVLLKKYSKDPRSLDVRSKQPWFDVKDQYGDIILTVRASDIDRAKQKVEVEYGDKLSDDWKVFRRPDETPEPEQKLSARAQVAKRIKEPKVTPAVAADNAQDSKELKARIGEPVPANYNGRWEVLNPNGELISHVTGNLGDAENARRRVMFRYENPAGVTVRPAPLPQATGTDTYEIVDRRTGQVVLRYQAADADDAGTGFDNWLRNQGMPVDTENYGYRPAQSVQDVPMDVAQNFTATPGSTPWRDQLAQTIRDSAPRADFELYQHETPNQVFHTMRNATADEVRAFIDQQEREGMPPGFLRVRQV